MIPTWHLEGREKKTDQNKIETKYKAGTNTAGVEKLLNYN